MTSLLSSWSLFTLLIYYTWLWVSFNCLSFIGHENSSKESRKEIIGKVTTAPFSCCLVVRATLYVVLWCGVCCVFEFLMAFIPYGLIFEDSQVVMTTPIIGNSFSILDLGQQKKKTKALGIWLIATPGALVLNIL